MDNDMFRSDETGILEIDKNTLVVSKNYMVELRRILDKVEIHYILDRVSFHSVEGSLALAKAIHNTRIWKVEKDGGVHIDNQFGHSAKFNYNHFVIPSLNIIRIRLENTGLLTSYEKFLLRTFTVESPYNAFSGDREASKLPGKISSKGKLLVTLKGFAPRTPKTKNKL